MLDVVACRTHAMKACCRPNVSFKSIHNYYVYISIYKRLAPRHAMRNAVGMPIAHFKVV